MVTKALHSLSCQIKGLNKSDFFEQQEEFDLNEQENFVKSTDAGKCLLAFKDGSMQRHCHFNGRTPAVPPQ